MTNFVEDRIPNLFSNNFIEIIGNNQIKSEEEWKDFESYSTNDYLRRSFSSSISTLSSYSPTFEETATTSLDIGR